MKNIKAVLFDSGRVLNGPVTGHWFITPNFWEYVDKSIFDSLDKIVSDAWPSLLDVYNENNMTSYFDSIVISSFLGTSKPDSKMYNTALQELNIKPEEAIFIDDSLKNCMGAMAVGINTVLLCRNKQAYISEKIKSISKGYKVINDLNQLYKFI